MIRFAGILKSHTTILLAIILIGVITINLSFSIISKVAKKSLEELARQGSQMVSDNLQKQFDMLEIIAKIDAVRDPSTSKDEKVRILSNFEESHISLYVLSDIGYVDLKGYVSSKRLFPNELYVGDQDYFRHAVNGEVYFEGPLLSRADGKKILVFAVPTYYNEKISGALISVIPTEYLSVLVEGMSYMDNGYGYILDGAGRIIAHRDRTLLFSRLSELIDSSAETTALAEMVAGKTGSGEYAFKGVQKYIGYHPIAKTDWSYSVVGIKDEVLGFGGMKKITVILVSVVVAAVSTLLLAYLYFIFLKKKLLTHQAASQNAIDTASIIIIKIDRTLNVLEFNKYAAEKLSIAEEDIIGRNISAILNQDNLNKLKEIIKSHIQGKIIYNFEICLRGKDEKQVYAIFNINRFLLKSGQTELLGIDISENIRARNELTALYQELKQNQEKLAYQAYHDALTGLPNRQKLKLTIDGTIPLAKDKNKKFAMLFIDIDNFKYVNDRLGHAVGDKILVEIARRLESVLMDSRTHFFRIGGDEFIIIIEDIKDIKESEVYAQKALTVFEKPYLYENETIYITASIGISLFPDDSESLDEMLKNADAAMYKAKDDGKNRYIFFNKSIRDALAEEIKLEENLRQAMKNDEFTLLYQPVYDLDTGKTAGFEALLRWNNPALGMVPPLKFIGAAEKSGLIIPLGEWVLRQACRFIREVHGTGHDSVYISVNISIIQIMQGDFAAIIQETLATTGLSADKLMLEITESVLMESCEDNIAKIKKLADMGIRIALDDFGEGYSSFGYLRKLPISSLKIDKSFINDISQEKGDHVAKAIITVGHQLDLEIIAEGVETNYQMDCLREYGCDKIQGYLISKPVPGEEAVKFLS